MIFSSISDFVDMGHHGLFVWSAYGICFLVLSINVLQPLLAHRRYLQQEFRRLRREEIT
ncbi:MULTISPECIES: heme exporter protein CcmD [Pseudomonas]|jgi:heme exporter protein D|uniref:Heme exporter protein D n=1 Tax=Pseudomonas reactans TaxID=117680 RepID=A0A7Y8G747_9PSED|nr:MULTISPECIES: heme exporter protein CcmD [Pseudomonas]MCK8654683.1 heme exporter protein CcmD [Pseudomonas umsongensis]NWA45960.1 heme exporter protein CcmD [Pseudomonas reactans]NWD98289.1 heme exporter protein CcmD [Pseudomonas reactans]NWE91815.1 heme exporter protein CcmD [Pseudomonas reactans]